MKKPIVDYREFRLSRLNEPRFSHLKLLGGWIVYFILYFITENLIPVEKCHVVWCPLDDMIPFNEWFILAYTFWYLLIVISLVYFMLYDIESFKNLQKFIIITQLGAMAVYIIWPSVQHLRPTEFPRHNFLTWVIGLIYRFDTPTGVCPSLHVAYSIGIASTWMKYKPAPRVWRWFTVFAAVIISLSTAFVKQHSTVDIISALPLSLLAEVIVFRRYYTKG
jgi:hypothetical protein